FFCQPLRLWVPYFDNLEQCLTEFLRHLFVRLLQSLQECLLKALGKFSKLVAFSLYEIGKFPRFAHHVSQHGSSLSKLIEYACFLPRGHQFWQSPFDTVEISF